MRSRILARLEAKAIAQPDTSPPALPEVTKEFTKELMVELAIALGPALFPDIRGSCSCNPDAEHHSDGWCHHLAVACHALHHVLKNDCFEVLPAMGIELSKMLEFAGKHSLDGFRPRKRVR